MKEIDLHGYRLQEAEDAFYELLNEARLKRQLIEITFITGTGAIQRMLKQRATEQDLYHYIPLANGGCIVVEFE